MSTKEPTTNGEPSTTGGSSTTGSPTTIGSQTEGPSTMGGPITTETPTTTGGPTITTNKTATTSSAGMKLTIFSSGKATREDSPLGIALGEYEYVPEFDYWVQTYRLSGGDDSQVIKRYVYKHSDSVYGLFSDLGGVWFQRKGSQWFYSMGSYQWAVDDTLTITHEPLNINCTSFLVSIYGAAYDRFMDSSGLFNITDNWMYGRPVYSNAVGELLYVCTWSGQWCIGDKFGRYAIKTTDKPVFPTSARGWVFWNGSYPDHADIEVQCDADHDRNVIPVWAWRAAPNVLENFLPVE